MRGNPGTFEDVTGQVFGKLTAISSELCKRRRMWMCKCECGGTSVTPVDRLKSGRTKTCGCSVFIRPFESLYNTFVSSTKKVKPGRRQHTKYHYI